FYIATPAFNPDNFKNNSNSFLKNAHESGLICVHKSSKFKKEITTNNPLTKLVRIDSFFELKSFFLATPRYGDNLHFPLYELSHFIKKSIQAELDSIEIIPITRISIYFMYLWLTYKNLVKPQDLPSVTFFIISDLTNFTRLDKFVLNKVQLFYGEGSVLRFCNNKGFLFCILNHILNTDWHFSIRKNVLSFALYSDVFEKKITLDEGDNLVKQIQFELSKRNNPK
ncbi:MAG TPA: hypothetical protein PLJ21_10615, partial [Pseudobdellovibrionaceae bacterium]|nr:hypothetical protein [Pseudobdellovibrionaceae bacterium]